MNLLATLAAAAWSRRIRLGARFKITRLINRSLEQEPEALASLGRTLREFGLPE